jgi:hypothetical protein
VGLHATVVCSVTMRPPFRVPLMVDPHPALAPVVTAMTVVIVARRTVARGAMPTRRVKLPGVVWESSAPVALQVTVYVPPGPAIRETLPEGLPPDRTTV